MVRATEKASKNDKSREFYQRRRQGIDRKVRTMITHLCNQFQHSANVTIIYEYRDEVSFFRSHLNENGARWFPSLEALRKASNTDLNTNMGTVDQQTLALLDWQNNAKALQPVTPPRMGAATTEDILGSTHSSLFRDPIAIPDRGNVVDMDEEGGNSEDDDEDEEEEEDTACEETENSDEEDDDAAYIPPRSNGKQNLRLPVLEFPNKRRPSPKRRRTDNGDSHLGQYQSPPIMYPLNSYTSNGLSGQLQVQNHPELGHAGLGQAGLGASLGTYPLNHGSSLPLGTYNAHQMEVPGTNPYTPYDMGQMADYNNTTFPNNATQEALSLRSQPILESSRGKKIRKGKSTNKAQNTKGRTRRTTN